MRGGHFPKGQLQDRLDRFNAGHGLQLLIECQEGIGTSLAPSRSMAKDANGFNRTESCQCRDLDPHGNGLNSLARFGWRVPYARRRQHLQRGPESGPTATRMPADLMDLQPETLLELDHGWLLQSLEVPHRCSWRTGRNDGRSLATPAGFDHGP